MSAPGAGHSSASSRRPSSKGNKPAKPLKSALDPIADSSAPSSFAVFGHAVSSWGSGGGDKLLNELAPTIMTPRFISNAQAISSASSSRPTGLGYPAYPKITFSSSLRRTTSSSLQIIEAIPMLLESPIPDAPTPPAGSASSAYNGGPVSFLRGFQATVPSSEKGKERRRKVRGGVAEGELGPGKLGVKKLGMKARGLLGFEDGKAGSMAGEGADAENEEGGEAGGAVPLTGKERRRRRRERERKGGAGAALGREELVRMEREIAWDRENLVVRKSLLASEIDEVTRKIATLEEIRSNLEDGILKLREQDLELEDELEGIRDRLFSLSAENGSLGITREASASIPSRRRKGPAFLPSEHDDLPSRVAFMTLNNHTGSITALDFSEPYGTLVSAASDESVRVWDLCSGEEVGRLRGHVGPVKAIQVDDQLCLTGGADGAIRLWDLRKVEDYEDRLASDEGGERGVKGEHIGGGATGGGAAPLEVLDGLMREEGAEVGPTEGLQPVAEEKDGNPCIRVLEGHSKSVTSLYYEEGCLVTGSSDKTIRQWDVTTGQCVLTMDLLWAISNAPPAPPSPSSSSFRGGEPLGSAGGYGGGYDLATNGGFGGSRLSSASLLSAASGTFAVPTPPYADGSWEMYQDFVGGVQFWGYALCSGSGDGGVRMWDMRTGQAHRTLIGHTGPVTSIQFDELHVVSGSLDRTIRIWDLRTGSVSDVLKYEYPVTALQFDTRKIVACTGSNPVDIYNRTSRTHSSLLTNGHTAPAERVRYQDRYLVSGGKDATVKVWSL